MNAPHKIDVRYVGGIHEVTLTQLPSGTSNVTVQRGEVVSLLAVDADAVLRSSEWEEASEPVPPVTDDDESTDSEETEEA